MMPCVTHALVLLSESCMVLFLAVMRVVGGGRFSRRISIPLLSIWYRVVSPELGLVDFEGSPKTRDYDVSVQAPFQSMLHLTPESTTTTINELDEISESQSVLMIPLVAYKQTASFYVLAQKHTSSVVDMTLDSIALLQLSMTYTIRQSLLP